MFTRQTYYAFQRGFRSSRRYRMRFNYTLNPFFKGSDSWNAFNLGWNECVRYFSAQ